MLRTGLPARDLEVIIEQSNGARVWALANIEAIKNGAGEVIGAINCLQDITERKALEIRNGRRLEDLEDFFQNGAVGLQKPGVG